MSSAMAIKGILSKIGYKIAWIQTLILSFTYKQTLKINVLTFDLGSMRPRDLQTFGLSSCVVSTEVSRQAAESGGAG